MPSFWGGVAYQLYSVIICSRNHYTISVQVIFLCLLLWGMVGLAYSELFDFYIDKIKTGLFSISHGNMAEKLYNKAISVFVIGGLLPLTVLACALIETYKQNFGKSLSLIGDISYSTYLIHFPISLVFYMIFILILKFDKSIFYTEIMLVIYFIVLVIVSILSHYKFERPMQYYLRKKYLKSEY